MGLLMNFAFVSADATRAAADLLVLPLFDSELTNKKAPNKTLAAADKKARGALLKLAESEGFKAKNEQSFLFQSQGKVSAAWTSAGAEFAAAAAARVCRRARLSSASP